MLNCHLRAAGDSAASRWLSPLHIVRPLRYTAQSRYRSRRTSFRATIRSPRPPHCPTSSGTPVNPDQPENRPRLLHSIFPLHNLGSPGRGHPAGYLPYRLAPASSNQHPRRRTPRPTSSHSLQWGQPPGHLHRPPHRQTMVPGTSSFQLQPPRRRRLASRDPPSEAPTSPTSTDNLLPYFSLQFTSTRFLYS